MTVVTAGVGTLAGLGLALLTNPFDGWLVLTMQSSAFIGTLIGLALGGLLHFCSRRRCT
jgi:hypothetical protein